MDIKFRGISSESKQFVYGYFITDELGTCLIVDEIKGIRKEVGYKSVEQFTGRYNQDGEIYQKVHLEDGESVIKESKAIQLLKYLKNVFDSTDFIQPDKIKSYSKDIKNVLNDERHEELKLDYNIELISKFMDLHKEITDKKIPKKVFNKFFNV